MLKVLKVLKDSKVYKEYKDYKVPSLIGKALGQHQLNIILTI